jgi:hypothetical protein
VFRRSKFENSFFAITPPPVCRQTVCREEEPLHFPSAPKAALDRFEHLKSKGHRSKSRLTTVEPLPTSVEELLARKQPKKRK